MDGGEGQPALVHRRAGTGDFLALTGHLPGDIAGGVPRFEVRGKRNAVVYQRSAERYPMTQRSSHFRDELGIIPTFMMVLFAVGMGPMKFLFLVAFPLVDPHAPPLPLRLIGAVVGGSLAAVYLLLVGYVNQDAKRRDMGQLLWTLLVIFIPNCLGFLAYFLLRKALVQFCSKCGGRGGERL